MSARPALACALWLLLTATALGEDTVRTTPGELYVEPATLHSLGFQWTVKGDTNRNGRVSVQYRRAGEEAWHESHGLLRLMGETVAPLSKKYAYTCGNLYAGSILFLKPATQYDVRLTLIDPDHGDQPVAMRELGVATKTPPRVFDGGRQLHVYPSGHEGKREQPAFDDFAAAYAAATPGDQIRLHAGVYGGNYKLNKRASRDKPIVIRTTGDGEVTFTGSGTVFDTSNATHLWIEGLTIREYGIAIDAPEPVVGLTITRCRFIDNHYGVATRSPASRDILISDCEFIGTEGSWHDRKNKSPYKAVRLAGQGIDVCYNRVVNHWDGLSTWRCNLTENPAAKLCAIDFYNNDISQIIDDNEADYGQHNIRFFRNRITNAFIGLSAQPIFGGPCYFVRNVMYNITRGVPFKLNRQPAGVLIYHNTTVTSADEYVVDFSDRWSNIHVYNNLFLGHGEKALRGGPVRGGFARFDYNAWRSADPMTVVWTDPWIKEGIVYHSYKPDVLPLSQLPKRFGIEQHGVLVGFDAVKSIQPADDSQTYSPNFGDARPRAGSPLIDAAKRIPGINDYFTGTAPDIGAFEFGQPQPHYGPREKAP